MVKKILMALGCIILLAGGGAGGYYVQEYRASLEADKDGEEKEPKFELPEPIPEDIIRPPRDAGELAALADEYEALDAENARFNSGLSEETNFEERLAALRGEGRPRAETPDRPGTPPPDWRPTPEEVEEIQVQRGDNLLTFLLVGVMFIVAASYMT